MLCETPAVASVHTRFETYFHYYGFGWAERAASRLGLSPEALAEGAAPEPRPPHDPRSDRLTAVGIDKPERGLPDPSDHVPVWCELDLA